MKHLAPIICLAALLVILLTVAGVVPPVTGGRYLVGVVVGFLIVAVLVTWREMARTPRRPRFIDVSDKTTGYLMGTATGYIHPGDAVKINLRDMTVAAMPTVQPPDVQ